MSCKYNRKLKNQKRNARIYLFVCIVLIFLPVVWMFDEYNDPFKKETKQNTLKSSTVTTIPYETWNNTYGGINRELGRCVRQTADGGYIITGETNSEGAGNYDVYLLKTDAYGNVIWNNTYGGTSTDMGHWVEQTTDGGYIIACSTQSYGVDFWDVLLIKTDASGNLIWEKTFGLEYWDESYCVQQTTDGGYIIFGFQGSFQYWLIKTDANGNLIWDRVYRKDNYTPPYINSKGYSVQQTEDGGYILVGEWYYAPDSDDHDIWMIKTDSSGNIIWEKSFGGTAYDIGKCVIQTVDGGYIIAGYTTSQGAGGRDFLLIRTDSNGNVVWENTYGGIDDDDASIIQQTIDYGFIVVGSIRSQGSGERDIWLVKVDPSGIEQWNGTYGSIYDEWGGCVDQNNDGDFIISGGTKSSDPNWDIFLIKVKKINDDESDSDGDGLTDYEEIVIYNTNYENIDTDNDNFLDGYEHEYGSNPLDPNDFPKIWQDDFNALKLYLEGNASLIQEVIDWYVQLENYMNANATLLAKVIIDIGNNATLLNTVHALATQNSDYLSQINGTLSNSIDDIKAIMDELGISIGDTDYDGLSDLDELLYGTSVILMDTDCDNLNDAFEIKYGTDPLDDDSDDDGHFDGIELALGTDPLDPNDYPGKVAPNGRLNIPLIIGSIIGVVSAVTVGILVGITLYLKRRKVE